MRIRISLPGSPDRETDFDDFCDREGFDRDELLEIRTTLNNGYEWAGSTPSGEMFTALRVNR